MAKIASTAPPIHDEIIRWLELPEHPNVFALGCFARQVTFASQQTRALNLVWALVRAGRLAAGQKVAVVGAGLGGLTAAVAALTKGCVVDLFDQASQPCPIQRGNDNRFIHPNILRWPEQSSRIAQTDFPFLNWTAASARGVIKQIELQWLPFTNNPQLSRFFNYKVDRIYAAPNDADAPRPSLAANRVVDGRAVGDETRDGRTPGYIESSYDCIVLSTGFGEERSIAGVPFLSYWENDSLHQEKGRERRSILVSGCGDGGLIDALRLRLRNFDHADFTRQFLDWQGNRAPLLIARLQKIDSELRRFALVPDLSLRFKAAYDSLDVPKAVERYFLERSRSDTRVTLNSPSAGPLTFGSSLLNRYATYLAMRYVDLRYLSGRIAANRLDDGAYVITLQREDVNLSDTHRFDLVIVRHGPESVIKSFASSAELTELRKLWSENEDLTTKASWRADDDGSPHGFFRDAVTRQPLRKEVIIDLARTTFDSTSREFFDDRTVQSVAVGEHEGHAGFIVTLKPLSPSRESVVRANVPVIYVVAPAAQTTPNTATVPRRPREGRLPLGAGIYNYSASERLKRKYRPAYESGGAGTAGGSAPEAADAMAGGLGTAGCFVADKSGKKYVITTGDALSVDSGARIGDKIFLEGQSPRTRHRPVARLRKIHPLHGAGEPPTKASTVLSIVAARLEPGVVTDFDALPPPWHMDRVRVESAGKVGKVGRTSGFTVGKIRKINVNDVDIMVSDARRITLNDCIEVLPEADSDFSWPGDTGAVVFHEKGSVIGVLIAGAEGASSSPGVTVVYPIEEILKKWRMQLVPSKRPSAAAAKSRRRRRRT